MENCLYLVTLYALQNVEVYNYFRLLVWQSAVRAFFPLYLHSDGLSSYVLCIKNILPVASSEFVFFPACLLTLV